jgi:Uma2 family endonuclease
MATITPLRVGPTDDGRKMSLEEFLDAEEQEGFRYELAKGTLEVTEVPDDAHRQVVTNLYDAMARYRALYPEIVLSYGGGAEFRLWLPGMVSGRNPDLGVVLRGAPKDLRGRRNPSLVAEVVSAGGEERDYQIKRSEYLIYGLTEYWIIDPQARRVILLTRAGDIWNEKALQASQRIESLVLPAFPTTVDELWIDLHDDSDDSAS